MGKILPFVEKGADTIVVEIFLAGDRNIIEATCKSFCFEVGLCVSVEPTRFIYTGGVEDGVKVRLVNYPRFPTTETELVRIAGQLAKRLVEAANEMSALIIAPRITFWVTRRPEEVNK